MASDFERENGSRFACAILVESWMNEMPLKTGYGGEFEVESETYEENENPWFVKI